MDNRYKVAGIWLSPQREKPSSIKQVQDLESKHFAISEVLTEDIRYKVGNRLVYIYTTGIPF
jgi:hypothetical protein